MLFRSYLNECLEEIVRHIFSERPDAKRSVLNKSRYVSNYREKPTAEIEKTVRLVNVLKIEL